MVTEDYVMEADLGPCSGHGLVVRDGVSLDCRGHAVVGSGSSSRHYGVYLPDGTRGASLRGCDVSGFLRGVRLRGAHHNRIIANRAHHNGDPVAHVGYGIDVARGSTDNVFQGNLIHDNADEGIHIGTGGHRNTLIGNSVYDNFLENIYVLRSDRGLFKNNKSWGGKANSLFVKHASSHRFENNSFRDRTALIRGDSHDNLFLNNEFVNAGIHFQAYQEDLRQTRPTRNQVAGGSITGAEKCIRFSNASGNLIKNVALGGCSVDVFSIGPEGPAENTLINMAPDSGSVSLDEHSLIRVGWHLDVSVRNENGAPVDGATVRGFDLQERLVFESTTDSNGNLPTQAVIEYSRTSSARIRVTPHRLHVAMPGHTEVVREVTVNGNKAVTVLLPGKAGR